MTRPSIEELKARILATRTEEHICHAKGCEVPVPPKLFMCSTHWFMLPKEKRDAIWREYKTGQEIRKNPTAEYLRVMRECIKFVADKEGK